MLQPVSMGTAALSWGVSVLYRQATDPAQTGSARPAPRTSVPATVPARSAPTATGGQVLPFQPQGPDRAQQGDARPGQAVPTAQSGTPAPFDPTAQDSPFTPGAIPQLDRFARLGFPKLAGSDETLPGQAEDPTDPAATDKNTALDAAKAVEGCQTCESRTYQDGSDDPGVSFKSPTKLDPDQAASAVRGHEMEHVVRNQAKARMEGRKVVSQSVTYHTAICPECGQSYVSGGTTRTATKGVQEPPAPEESKGKGKEPFSAYA